MQRMLRGQRIAVVGLSDNPSRAAHRIAQFLRSDGREVIPVNPNFDEVMGVRCYPTVASIPETVDVVDVFRRSEFCADVVRDAIDAKASGVWLQSGIINTEARHLAEEAGLGYVEDRCLMVEIMHAN
ncbi:MAG: CoA-binding protein [Anaerolineae bacterium]|nr:CoA-binding protein [Phycisphaerae bacterium]